MLTQVQLRFKFDAVHTLEHAEFPENRVHGHTFHLQVTMSGPVRPVEEGLRTEPLLITGKPIPLNEERENKYRPDVGMIADPFRLSRSIKRHLINNLHNSNLNELDFHKDFENLYPTVEHLAVVIAHYVQNLLPPPLKLLRVALADRRDHQITLDLEKDFYVD